MVTSGSPYREPAERSEWKPRAGERIVILPTEWSMSWGHVGKKGHVVRTHGWCPPYEVYVGPPSSLYVYLADIAPLEEQPVPSGIMRWRRTSWVTAHG